MPCLQGKESRPGKVALVCLVRAIQRPPPESMAGAGRTARLQLCSRLQAPLCAEVACSHRTPYAGTHQQLPESMVCIARCAGIVRVFLTGVHEVLEGAACAATSAVQLPRAHMDAGAAPDPYVPAPMVMHGTAQASGAPLERWFSASESESSSELSASHRGLLDCGCNSMVRSRSAPLSSVPLAAEGTAWPVSSYNEVSIAVLSPRSSQRSRTDFLLRSDRVKGS